MLKDTLLTILCSLCLSIVHASAADNLLVEQDQPRAEIVITDNPARTTRLAAQELQKYVKKISGAKLNIVTEPSGEVPVRIFVGQSSYTEKLGITAEGLKYGAYRIVSGEHWLVLIGDDTNFVPIEPWPRNNNDLVSGKMQQAWDKITGAHWGYPHSQLYKHYSGSTTLFGTPQEQFVDKNGNVNVWGYDERGSFNAVCGLLRSLGVRWYLPGDLGEIVPEMKTIAIPNIDQTVHPDFPLRTINFRFSVYGRDAALWAMRLGVRQPYGRQAAHGLDHMTQNEHTLKNHPLWFALYGGKRHNQLGSRLNQLCYSNEELFQETVRFARAQFDQYNMDVVSIMPPDGYTAMCQCKLCEGKDTPEHGYRGALSDYVWKFVNRVAKEVRKTHPDKKISNCAYGTYTQPPRNIDKLEPNVQVIIVGGRRPTSEAREELRQLRKDWSTKTDNPIIIFENYPLTGRGFYLPAYIPRTLGESINEIKGISRGEDIWLTMNFREDAIGYNHFLIYFSARMYWGGKAQSVQKIFDEYCQLFYGPAANEMQTFFKYCEDHWREMEKESSHANRALELFAIAKSKTSDDSVYAHRIKLIDNYLNGLRNKSIQLAQKRGPVPRLRLVSRSRDEIVIDGKLDDQAWEKCSVASTGQLRELQTGRQPIYGTSIKTNWNGNNLYFAIRCEDRKGKPLNVATVKNGDQAIWYGDAIEILLDTESHSYYQIAVNPAGAVNDLDRGADRNNWFRWDSQAEVATHVGDDHWTVEIRIPIVQDKNDPLHQVIGHKPTQSLPWHINVCRQRIRKNGSEYSAFSPTGTAGFHEPMKFAHFYHGLSHQFDADPSVTDYLIESRTATLLMRKRKYKDALAAYMALNSDKKTTEFQQSDALQHAARCARNLNDFVQAENLAQQIPIASVTKTVQMENLLAERKFDQVIKQFGNENFAQWPFWQIGAGAYARARAYVSIKAGDKAEADLQIALEYTVDGRIRTNILYTLGNNREINLQNENAALTAYRQNFESVEVIGGADEFRSVLGAAQILRRQKKFDESLKTLQRAKIEKLKGYWRHALLQGVGETLVAADRKDEALKVFQEILKDNSTAAGQQRAAQEQIDLLNQK